MPDTKTIIQQLSLEQKCALLSGAATFKTRALPQYGIPAIWLSDGPHGLRKQAGPADHLGQNPSEPATCFPTASAVASSWDPALGEEIGRALGEEAAAQDVAVVLGPGLNTKRSPLCGRNFEYFSEDPYLSGKMAAAYIRGIQANGVAACPKHFAANSQELRRMATDSVVDERTLRELYLTNFEIAVKEGAPKTIMTSYNLVNGTYANENPHLLKEILRDDWGFTGAVVTDWGGSNDHALGVKNGSTLEMPAPGLDSVRELIRAVQDGKISEVDVNARLEELLTLVDSTTAAVEKAPKTIDWDAHHALARKAAAESIVLLKNKGGLLPLDPAARVAVIGDFADKPRYQGAGSSLVNAPRVDSFRQVFEASGLRCAGYAKGFDRNGRPDPALQAEAVSLAEQADVVLLFLGLDEVKETEGLDRSDMKLAPNQIDLLLAVHRANPRLAVVLSCGSAVETGWASHCQALVWAGLSGQAGAGAVLDVLTGKVNPAGRLAETWPLHCEDNPSCKNFGRDGRTVEYREGLYVGYRYYQTAGVPVAYPFGYGLSYTAFEYSGLHATPEGVTLTVKNTGSLPGDEVVAGVCLEARRQNFPPDAGAEKALPASTWKRGRAGPSPSRWTTRRSATGTTRPAAGAVEGGSYTVRVGASSEDIRLEGTVTVGALRRRRPLRGAGAAPLPERPGAGRARRRVRGAFGPRRPAPESRHRPQHDVGRDRPRPQPLGWLVHVIHKHLLDKSLQSGTPDLNLLFNYNMPLRAIAKMTGGMVSMGMVDGLVMELKGFWIIGILRVLFELVKNLILNASMEKRLNLGGKEAQP